MNYTADTDTHIVVGAILRLTDPMDVELGTAWHPSGRKIRHRIILICSSITHGVVIGEEKHDTTMIHDDNDNDSDDKTEAEGVSMVNE